MSPLVPRAVTVPAARVGAAVQNALEVARFGGLDTGEEPSPYEVAAEEPVYRLRHYFPPANGQVDMRVPPDQPAGRGHPQAAPPVVLVPPMMLAAEVYDVSPSSTAVGILREHGADPWVVDFGAPEKVQGGLKRTLADHVLAVSDAVDRVRKATGRDVVLGGYSQGGMFCYQTAAFRRNKGIDSLVTFGSPVDVASAIPLGIPEQVAVRAAGVLADTVGHVALPAWASRLGFRMLDPVKAVRQQISFVAQLHDREALLPRERQRRFLQGEGWVAWPGPALADFMQQFVAHNRMLAGGFLIEDQTVTLADIECPVLTFVGTVDEIAPAAAVRALPRAAPRAEIYEIAMRAGHFGLVVGSLSSQVTWPAVAQWARWRAGTAEKPELAVLMEAGTPSREQAGRGLLPRLGLAAGATAGLARAASSSAVQTVRGARAVVTEAARELPRLARLGQIQPHTRISLGLLLDEQARRAPESVCFLFQDRAHTHGAVKGRIDNVVRGLIQIGVRPGEPVGVLMNTRPSALAVIAALNRLGAVAVLLRPDGELELEVELGRVTRIIADPEHAERATHLGAVHPFLLGGGGGPRDVGLPLTDMEQIDPDAVTPPRWYRPNPGRAGDLAFVLFTGHGQHVRAKAITNGRWALSAFGTASSAALTSADTVYSLTPLHHASALLMSIGGAIAGGARLAITGTIEPETFWDEVRRYGVTVASYTWTSLRALTEAPPHIGERHHPVRLFIGSGMPRGLWHRVQERFAPARVLEFYASTEGEAVLVNVSGVKEGSLGRPLPGSAEVRIATYDITAGRLLEGPDGYAIECGPDEVGMLLAREQASATTSTPPLRSVFSREDAWHLTGDLFRRDGDGDHWWVDHVGALAHGAGGPVPTIPIRDALGALPAVDLAVAYGVPDGEFDIPVAAVTLRTGHSLRPAAVTEALSELDPVHRPLVVHVVGDIPVTTWGRPITASLRAAGVPEPGGDVWVYDERKDGYKALTAAARKRLVASGSPR